MTNTMKKFIAAILAMGFVRFALDWHGVSKDVVKFFSMTVIIMIGTIYFALTTRTHKERLKASYLLILPYMIVEVLALAYTWNTGRQTIFHDEEYSLGFPIAQHTIGHFVGGLTWEPLSVFVLMEIIWFISSRLRPRTN
jgi:hypothetical protein